MREALVEGRTRLRASFLEHNRRVQREVEYLEAKIRRRDILVDEQHMVDFYLERLPAHVHSIAALEKWLKESERHAASSRASARDGADGREAKKLFVTPADWMRREVPEVTSESHPDTLEVAGNALPLEYRFEPGTPDDGITIVVPLPILNELDPSRLSWLIPGWRFELLTELLRGLPKSLRKSFVPVPEAAAKALRELDQSKSVHAALAEWIARNSGVQMSEEELAAISLPDHLKFNLRVVDADGKTVAQGRDLLAVRRAVRARERKATVTAASASLHRAWDFGSLEVERQVERGGLRFTVYPTLRDRGDGVERFEARTHAEAELMLRTGVLRLLVLALPDQFKYARKRFAEHRELILLSRGIDLARPLADGLALKCFEEAFLGGGVALPRNAEAFARLLNDRRGRFGDVVDRVLAHTLKSLEEHRAARQKLASLQGEAFSAVRYHVDAHLRSLVPEDFPTGVSPLLWPHLPRYFRAVARRLDKVPGNIRRDAELSARVAPWVRAYAELAAAVDRAMPHPELDRLQWMIEELRVSVFAQELGTAVPVSEKRVAEQVERAKQESYRL